MHWTMKVGALKGPRKVGRRRQLSTLTNLSPRNDSTLDEAVQLHGLILRQLRARPQHQSREGLPLDSSQSASMDELASWADQHGAVLHPSVELFNDANTGFSFRVRDGHSLKPGDSIVACPLSLTLSYLNTLPELHSRGVRVDDTPFPQQFLNDVPPHVIGRFFLIKQYLLGAKSFWHSYIRNLPQPEHLSSWGLPPFWLSDDIDLLEDTNVHNAIGEIKSRLKSEHKHATALLNAADGDWRDYTRVLYNWAYSIFTSRSFRPSRILDDHGNLPLPSGCKIDDFSVLMPVFDIGNHSPAAQVDWDVHQQQDTTMTITTLKTGMAYAAGDQVFNNYGEKTNAELMLAYGFLVPESTALHNDYVHLQLRAGPPPDEGGTQTAEAKAANEFFFSLRPVTDSSSPTGRKRSLLPNLLPHDILPAFRHVQDKLVWQLILLQTTEEQRQALLPVPAVERAPEMEGVTEDQLRLKLVLTGKTSPEFRPLLEQTFAIIQHKAMLELEKLEQSDFEVDEDQEADLTRNQSMALLYRTQCRKVLVKVLESLEMPET